MKVGVKGYLKPPGKGRHLYGFLQLLHLPFVLQQPIFPAPPINLIRDQRVKEIAVLIEGKVFMMLIDNLGQLHEVLRHVFEVLLHEIGEF